MDVELIRIYRALNHRFAEAIAGGDEHDLVESGFRIHRKHHTRCATVRAHHALHTGRQRHIGVSKAFVHAIGNRPIVVERGEDFLYGVENIVVTVDVQKAFLLPGKRGVR